MIKREKSNYIGIGDETITKLVNSKIGKVDKGKKRILLNPIEALYVIEIRGEKSSHTFEDILKDVIKRGLMKRYIVYRDLRRRGLKVLLDKVEGTKKPLKVYEGKPININGPKIKGVFDKSANMTFSGDKEGLYYYKMFWLGQYGVYKTKNTGRIYSLSPFETQYLKEKKLIKVEGFTKRRIKHFSSYYKIFKEWWNAGFVLKSGFKFGNDFRLYMPGTTPERFEHSKHVIHVFPKEYKITAEELSMSIRVAHGVRKTYILAIPGKIKPKKTKPDFYVINREGEPTFAVKAFFEKDVMDSRMIMSFLKEGTSLGLIPVLAIIDSDTSVTYYTANEVLLKGGKAKYFEMRWIQP